MISEAIQSIIKRRDVHIDQLLDKLKDPRVRSIIEPMILGDEGKIERLSDDYNYVSDLGLIRMGENGIEPANPIYGEVMVRTLNFWLQDSLRYGDNPYQLPKYYNNGKIDIDCLLSDFQEFWRENGAIWLDRFDYKEAAPHLILMAFLQRVINGGGDIRREMAAESGRLDLCVIFSDKKYPIELKILRGSKTEQKGIEQTLRYMNSLGCADGWLVIFDRDPDKSWDEKIYTKVVTTENGKTITVVGV
jgi:hypothetical protein